MAGNAPAFGSSELRLTAKQALFSVAWPRHAMKRQLRRGGWLGRQDSNLRVPVQDVLWHRLCDSDVMVMLETPTYFDNKWTRHEIARALTKEIHVLRVVWPEHQPSKLTELAKTIYLSSGDLRAADGPIRTHKADTIALSVERLRSRSIASRYLSITGRLRADVQKFGARVEGIGAHRAIAVRLPDDRRVWAYPVVGIPTAEILNDIADKARSAGQREQPVLGPTVADLAARYMEKHVAVSCKASAAEGIRGLLGKYVLPEIGKLPLLAVERERVAAFHVRFRRALRATSGWASLPTSSFMSSGASIPTRHGSPTAS